MSKAALAAPLLIAALTLTACSAEKEPPPAVGASADGPSAGVYATDLKGVCPDTVDVQIDWWPQADYGFLFHLIGPGGDVDANTFTYSGPLGETGVNLAVHSGGAAVGFQSTTSLLYKDDSVLLGVTSTEQSIENAKEFPTVAVFTPLQRVPLVLYWGNQDWDFDNLTDIKEAGVTVLTVESAPYLKVLLAEGLLDQAQIDNSYSGDPARFVIEEGNVVQQGYLTSEIYQYQNDLPEWNKPLKWINVGEEYPALYHQLSIRSDRLEDNRECLAGLVPIFQQAGIDYAKDPSAGNKALEETAAGFTGSGWELSDGLLDWAAKTLVEERLIANGPDGAYGSLPLDTFAEFIDTYRDAVAADGIEVSQDLKVGDFATNEFIDPELKL
ncbi:MAG: hypothetical protein LBC97_03835 [Bifidobacteriaceae bacterium]|jgi:hypothetical protein|nr:hypothetical protein [Bifidobacteriaceae bacterium]